MDDKATLQRRGQTLRSAIDKVVMAHPEAKPLLTEIAAKLDTLKRPVDTENIQTLKTIQDNLRERARGLIEHGLAKQDEFEGLL